MKTSNLRVESLPRLSSWSYKNFAGSARIKMPGSDFVVTRNLNGEPLSRFGDETWIFLSGDTVASQKKINFISWGRDSKGRERLKLQLIEEMKWVFGLFLWFRPTGILSASSLKNKFSMLRNFASYALGAGITMVEVLSSEKHFVGYSAQASDSNVIEFGGLVTLLEALGSSKTGIKLVGIRFIKDLQDKCNTTARKFKQDPPLPSRLFSKWIIGLLRELGEFENMFDKIVAGHMRGKGSADAMFLENHDLSRYFDERAFSRTWSGFVGALTFGQTVCYSVIQTFSGMRTHEVNAVPFNCLNVKKRKWGSLFLINGITTKGNGGGQETAESWITSDEGAQAVATAQRIAEYIYKVTGAADRAANGQPRCLFVSTGYLDGVNVMPNSEIGIARTSISLGNDNGLRLLERIDLVIGEEELAELSRIEPHRKWSDEPEFHCGKRWKVRSRQIRRSLAMYASASGLVTLPALKWQLKHLTRDMTSYYTKGAKALRRFAMDNKKHFAIEYQTTQIASQALSYNLNVIESDEPISGGHGHWLKVNMAKNGGTVSAATRSQTELDFRKGKIAYKETPMGGCTTVIPCEKHMMRVFTECLGCSRSVIIPSKFDRSISVMEKFVASLPIGSLEHRSEMHDLNEMKRIRGAL